MSETTPLEEQIGDLREWKRRKQAALGRETAVHRRNSLAREIESLDRELDRRPPRHFEAARKGRFSRGPR